jgi:hypothetical protein
VVRLPDESNAQQEFERGERAKQLLDDPLLLEAFEEADKYFVYCWRGAESTNQRELEWSKQKALAEVKKVLAVFIERGDYARRYLEQEKSK